MFEKLIKRFITVEEQPLESSSPQYEKPKILLIDLPDECFSTVKDAGFNVCKGSFGAPYKVVMSDGYSQIIGTSSLPNYTEQEIVFIDLTTPELLPHVKGEKAVSEGRIDWWASHSFGYIDPRPKLMSAVQKEFRRIFSHGGVFVVFAQPYLTQKYYLGRINQRTGYFEPSSEIPANNWSFLPLQVVGLSSDTGREVVVRTNQPSISAFLHKHSTNIEYTTTFTCSDLTYHGGNEKFPFAVHKGPSIKWEPILSSKFNKCLAGILSEENCKGRILLLPQFLNKSEVIIDLLQEVLPDLSPHLFPHITKDLWTHKKEYELEPVLQYEAQKIEIQQKAKAECEKLAQKIEEERKRWGFLHEILTQSGSKLVDNVRLCLECIGFQNIVDVDKEFEKRGDAINRQEDLQILDREEATLLIEIKGLSYLPRETDTIQVVKYVPRRMQEWGRTNVRGVSIINHQRNIPGLQRDHNNVFTEQQMQDASHQDITLLTTWDLFLLTRGMLKWRWSPKGIQDLFYQERRIPILPSIYSPVGKVEKFWDKISVVSIKITADTLHQGQRIGYILPDGYLEEKVTSLQCEKQNIMEAIPGQLVGIKTEYSKDILRKGTLVCKVIE